MIISPMKVRSVVEQVRPQTEKKIERLQCPIPDNIVRSVIFILSMIKKKKPLMRPPKTHTLYSPWGMVQGTAVEITHQYNQLVEKHGCQHATVTLSQVRRLLRGGLNRPVNGNMYLRPPSEQELKLLWVFLFNRFYAVRQCSVAFPKYNIPEMT